MIPIGIESVSQKIVLLKTSVAVTGAALSHRCCSCPARLTKRLAKRPLAHQLPEEAAVLLPDRAVQAQALGDTLYVRRRRALSRRRAGAGSDGVTKKIMYVTIVTARKRTIARGTRRIRYWSRSGLSRVGEQGRRGAGTSCPKPRVGLLDRERVDDEEPMLEC